MTYVAVPDKNAGDTLTQAMWATYLEGNLNGGVDRPLWDSGVLASPLGSIDILSIPQTFAHLLIECALLSDQAAIQNVNIAFNNDTTATNYSRNAPALAAAYTAGQANDNRSGLVAMSTANVALGPGLLFVPAYTGAQKKGWLAQAAYRDAATTSALQLGGGHWIAAGATAAITRITLTPAAGSFAAGSRLTLYGQGYI